MCSLAIVLCIPLSNKQILGKRCTGLISSSAKDCRPHSGFVRHT